LNALSIRHVGARVAAVLAEHFGSMEKLRAASVEELTEVEEVGSIIAESVHKFLHSEFGRRVIDDLAAEGVKMEAQRRKVASGPLSGKTLVVTGTLEHYSREEIEDLIEKLGGKAASSVSKSTDFLVAGEKAGSKLDKAQKLGVKILTETEFKKLIS
jgi:DNA ligase (NAD+)